MIGKSSEIRIMKSGLGKASFASVGIDMVIGVSMHGYSCPSVVSSLTKMKMESKKKGRSLVLSAVDDVRAPCCLCEW